MFVFYMKRELTQYRRARILEKSQKTKGAALLVHVTLRKAKFTQLIRQPRFEEYLERP